MIARLFVLAALTASLSACGSGGISSGGDPAAPIEPTTARVVFTLDGNAADGADLTYSAGNGTEQQQGVAVPLTNKSGDPGLIFEVEPGAFLYFSAQNAGRGSLTCSISVDGRVVSRHTSSGEFAIVSCDGSAS